MGLLKRAFESAKQDFIEGIDRYHTGDPMKRTAPALLRKLRDECDVKGFIFAHLSAHTKKMVAEFKRELGDETWIDDGDYGGSDLQNKLPRKLAATITASITAQLAAAVVQWQKDHAAEIAAAKLKQQEEAKKEAVRAQWRANYKPPPPAKSAGRQRVDDVLRLLRGGRSPVADGGSLLDLSGTPVRAKDIDALSEVWNASVTRVMFNGCLSLGEEGGLALAGLLKENPAIVNLYARGCGFTEAVGQALLRVVQDSCDALGGPSLKVELVDLDNNLGIKYSTRVAVTRAAGYNQNRVRRFVIRPTPADPLNPEVIYLTGRPEPPRPKTTVDRKPFRVGNSAMVAVDAMRRMRAAEAASVAEEKRVRQEEAAAARRERALQARELKRGEVQPATVRVVDGGRPRIIAPVLKQRQRLEDSARNRKGSPSARLKGETSLSDWGSEDGVWDKI